MLRSSESSQPLKEESSAGDSSPELYRMPRSVQLEGIDMKYIIIEQSHNSSELCQDLSQEEVSLRQLSQTNVTDTNMEVENILIESIKSEPINSFLNMVLLDLSLKAVAFSYMSFGIVIALASLSKRIVQETDISNKTWNCLGLIKSFLSFFVAALILRYKMLIYNNSHYLKKNHSKNKALFYLLIVISAIFSCVYLLIVELRTFDYNKKCAVQANMILPISEIFLILVGLMIIYDLIFFEVEPNAPKGFFLFYKAAALLFVVDCGNFFILNLLDIIIENIQINISKYNNSLKYYYRGNGNLCTDNSVMRVHSFFQVFTIIYFISSIVILIKSFRQFSNYLVSKEETQAISCNNFESIPSGHSRKYIYIPLILASILFFIGIVGVLLDLISEKSSVISPNSSRIIVNFLSTCLYIFSTSLNVYLLKVLYNKILTKNCKKTDKVDSTILWVSLCGQFITYFVFIINSSKFPRINNEQKNRNGSELWKIDVVDTLSITSYCGALVESFVQTVIFSFINKYIEKQAITQNTWRLIQCPTFLLISTNLGFLISNWYLLSGHSSFRNIDNQFHLILSSLLHALGQPLSLIFRAYCIIFLIQFLSYLIID